MITSEEEGDDDDDDDDDHDDHDDHDDDGDDGDDGDDDDDDDDDDDHDDLVTFLPAESEDGQIFICGIFLVFFWHWWWHFLMIFLALHVDIFLAFGIVAFLKFLCFF